jgi:hypothetical protein
MIVDVLLVSNEYNIYKVNKIEYHIYFYLGDNNNRVICCVNLSNHLFIMIVYKKIEPVDNVL